MVLVLFSGFLTKVSKGAKIRNRYNQVSTSLTHTSMQNLVLTESKMLINHLHFDGFFRHVDGISMKILISYFKRLQVEMSRL